MNARAAAVDALNARLGHAFHDDKLLDRALTHASVGGVGGRNVRDNEVLEFIGDRVIGLLAAEGDLAVRLNAVVSRAACARVARAVDMGPALRLSPSETKGGGRDKDSILAGACEAVMAAIYQDGGLEAARRVFLDLWSELLIDVDTSGSRDPKTILQEWAQARGKPLPAYAVTGRSGPDHAPTFTVAVEVAGLAPVTAQGRSRQEAEKAAAAQLLAREQNP